MSKLCVDCKNEFNRVDESLEKCAICRINSLERYDERQVRMLREAINPVLKEKRYFSKN